MAVSPILIESFGLRRDVGDRLYVRSRCEEDIAEPVPNFVFEA